MNLGNFSKLNRALTLVGLIISYPVYGTHPVTQALGSCKWSSVVGDAEAKEDLQALAEQLAGSKLFGGEPTASEAAKALARQFDPAKIHSEIELANYIDDFMRLRNWSPELREVLLSLHPKRAVSVLTRYEGSLLPLLDKVNQQHGARFAPFLKDVLSHPERFSGQTTFELVAEAIEVFPLPEANIGVIDLGGGLKDYVHLNKGTGASSYVYRGTFNGKTVAVKVQKDAKEDFLAEDDFKVLQSLRPLGGPEVYGVVKLRDERGYWRRGVALELIPGKDLLSLRFQNEGGQPLSLKVTQAHVTAFENLMKKVERDHLHLGDIQPGDFMLQENGRIVPLDMKVTAVPREKDGSLARDVKASLTFLGEQLEKLKELKRVSDAQK